MPSVSIACISQYVEDHTHEFLIQVS